MGAILSGCNPTVTLQRKRLRKPNSITLPTQKIHCWFSYEKTIEWLLESNICCFQRKKKRRCVRPTLYIEKNGNDDDFWHLAHARKNLPKSTNQFISHLKKRQSIIKTPNSLSLANIKINKIVSRLSNL